jgi:hypothetical protein
MWYNSDANRGPRDFWYRFSIAYTCLGEWEDNYDWKIKDVVESNGSIF